MNYRKVIHRFHRFSQIAGQSCGPAILAVVFVLLSGHSMTLAQDGDQTTSADRSQEMAGSSGKSSGIAAARARYEMAERAAREHANSISVRNRMRGPDESNNRKVIQHRDRLALRKSVEKAFEARQELLRLELAEFQTRLQSLTRRLADRERSRSAILDRRVEELLDPSVKWDAEAPSDTSSAGPDAGAETGGTLAAGTNKPGTDEEPTFDGIPYSQWLKTLETERNPEKVFDAVKALKTMPNERDASRLARGFFRALRTLPFNVLHSNAIYKASETQWAVQALQALPAVPVVDALIDEIRDGHRYLGSRMVILLVLRSVYETDGPVNFEHLGDEITRRASDLLKAFAAAKDIGQDNLGLILDLLKKSGDKPAEIDGLAPLVTAALARAGERKDRYLNWLFLIAQVEEIDPDFPAIVDAIPQLIERLRTDWDYALKTTGVTGITSSSGSFTVELLGRFGSAARPALPLLREIAATEWSAAKAFELISDTDRKKFKQTVAEAIAKIEAPQKPRPPRSPNASGSKSAEPTFDGVEYSRWLKMLETERKPEKLATAMDACSRLAVPGDEPRIARGIFLAARLFETGDSTEQDRVWSAGWRALNRLRAGPVIDELLFALRDDKTYESGRGFEGRFVADKMESPLAESTKPRAAEIIGELMRLAGQNGKGAGWLLAAASTVWRHTERPVKDFEGLEPAFMTMIDTGFSMRMTGTPEIIGREWMIVATNLVEKAPETSGLAATLMKHANESYTVIGLIGKMGRHAEPVVPLLVDQFLAEWKKYEDEIRRQAEVEDPNARRQKSSHEGRLGHFGVALIKALGEIGVGPKAYALVRDLKAIILAPARQQAQNSNELQFFRTVEQAFARFSPPPNSEQIPVLLSDFWFIAGDWKLRSLVPGKTPPDIVAEIRKVHFSWLGQIDRVIAVMNAIGSPLGYTSFVIDETKSPKRITLIYSGQQNVPAYRGEGIYELEGKHLKIELAKPGVARPKEFSRDDRKLPEGHVLMEFDRDLPPEKNVPAGEPTDPEN